MSARLWIAIAALLAMMPALAHAADDRLPRFPDAQTQEQWKRAEEFARKGMDELLRSLELFRDALPRYGAPYVDENGNIVIPRKRRSVPPFGAPVPMPGPERA